MLVVRDLIKTYPGPVAALKGISLDVPRGMFGLLGPNGAGKTTFMKILSGLLEATSGTVTLDGDDILAHPERLWPRLGYLPQEFGFYPHLTGEQMLRYLLELKGIDPPGGRKAYGRELLQRVNLTFAARRKVKAYSGGMRQRLGIAQALAGNPDLIIVDEPTAGLDPEERLRFYRLLAELAENRCVLLSTHIVEDVAVLCPRFAVIRSGKLVALTTPSEAKVSLEGAVFEGAVGHDELAQLYQSHRVIQAILVEGRNRARVHAPDGNIPAGFEPVTATLEDAYLVLMGENASTEDRGLVRYRSGSEHTTPSAPQSRSGSEYTTPSAPHSRSGSEHTTAGALHPPSGSEQTPSDAPPHSRTGSNARDLAPGTDSATGDLPR